MSESKIEQSPSSESSAGRSDDSSARSERGDLNGGRSESQATASQGSDSSGKGDSGTESKGNSTADASSRNERGGLGEYAAAMKDGGMSTKDAASAPGKDGSGDANQTHDPRADKDGQGQSSAGGDGGKGTETKTQERSKVETQGAKTQERTKSETGGKAAEQAKTEAGGAKGQEAKGQEAKGQEAKGQEAKGQEAKGQGETKDKRTDEQIAKELEQRTGKSIGELILSLGHGPVQMNMRDLEKGLEANGTIKHRTEDHTPPKVIDNVTVPHQYQDRRYVTEGRVGTEQQVDRAQERGRDAVAKDTVSGFMGGLRGGAKTGESPAPLGEGRNSAAGNKGPTSDPTGGQVKESPGSAAPPSKP